MRPYWTPSYRSAAGGDTPAVLGLLCAMGIIFIVDWALHGSVSAMLSWPITTQWFRVLPMLLWQPLTFPFVHASSFLYLITDGIVLYFFGGSLERAWGSGKFLIFFFASGLVAGFGAMAVSPWLPAQAFFIGMMGSFVAMVVAFAAMNPYMTVLLIVFPLQARWLAVLSVAWELFGRSDRYGGPAGAIISVGVTVLFAYIFATNRLSLAALTRRRGGPSFRERMERWQQKRRMREWQKRVSRVQRPEDLFKDKK